MSRLNLAQSDHVVKLLVDPAAIITPASAVVEGLDAAWVGMVRRLVMEYCPSGSLSDLRRLRMARAVRLEELTLWRIFECLVDGCAVLEYRSEFDIIGGIAQIPAATVAGTATDPGVMVHFDLKPANIMTMRDVASHPDTPLCKIGDFGFASNRGRIPPNAIPNAAWATNQRLRDRGTDNYLAPSVVNMARKPMSGALVKSCMSLACYDFHPVEAHIPFTPGPLSGTPALGRAFGTEIQGVPNISATLKDAIQECLYEVPANRPTLLTLKRRIMASINALVTAGAEPEGWQDLEHLEPLTE
ncbi:hypothetical protein BKA61DRAFT_578196 [Leptodontidium sp. MPI-SDFR-AT-0119]|nr:hypothetical protein BKA61DRAFT_578196 [Leptodontidium sp. MPI-SDFR-AT-0119]